MKNELPNSCCLGNRTTDYPTGLCNYFLKYFSSTDMQDPSNEPPYYNIACTLLHDNFLYYENISDALKKL